jgi:hypothetical protein
MRKSGCGRSTGAIGIIGGADGPTTVFISKPDAGWQKTLERCKNVTIPRASRTTGDELAQHLIDEYGAYEVPVSGGKRLALRMSVLMNQHSEALSQPPMPPENADRETWQAWAEQSQMDIEAARDIPDEQYGLRYRFLAVPRTEKTERFYEEAVREFPKPPKRFWHDLINKKTPPARTKKMLFGIELSTGYCQLDDGCKSLMDEVTLWRGVTREDIDKETPEFMAYAAAMRDAERL